MRRGARVELRAGGTLGRYQLLDRAGGGGMAVVWKAQDPNLGRLVAIKVMRPPDGAGREQIEQFVARFDREARVISRLDHPNILAIHDFGEDDGVTYMVMPFLAGGTLAQNLGQPWSVQAAVRVLEPLASALDYARERGIIHRDVKPSNVLIGEGGRVVLADFGIARLTEAPLTQSIVGTPAYMAPEQVQGEPATSASDQYSLGIVAYEMLTGRRPFEAETPLAVVLAHVHRPLPPPRTLNPALSEDVERVLFKALAKQPADRHGSASAFVAALTGVHVATDALPVEGASLTASPLRNVNEDRGKGEAPYPDQPPAARRDPSAVAEERDTRMTTGQPIAPSSTTSMPGEWPWILGAAAVLILVGLAISMFFNFVWMR